MKILQIDLYTNNYSNNNNFKAHPDFIKLARKYDVDASSFFRRGSFYGAPSEDFINIINLFKQIFQKNLKQKMLIAGIGKSQEPFSYLATIKSLFKNKNLNEILELKTIDLQSRPTEKELFEHSYYEYNEEPPYARSSFVKDFKFGIDWLSNTKRYRVNNEIFDFLNYTYKNNSLWDTRLQEEIKTIPNNEFDIISINNTLIYIDKAPRFDILKNVHRILKTNGTFITDPYWKPLEDANLSNEFLHIGNGIYKKI